MRKIVWSKFYRKLKLCPLRKRLWGKWREVSDGIWPNFTIKFLTETLKITGTIYNKCNIMKLNWDLRWSWKICLKILRSGENGRFGMNILCGRLEYNGETIRKDGSRTRISRIWRNNTKMEHWDSGYLLTMANWKVLNQYKVTYLIWLLMHLSRCQLIS